MERAETRIRETIADDAKLQTHVVRVFRQGSYHNRTNVPRESDVDIRVEVRDVQFSDFYFVETEASRAPDVRARLEAEARLTSRAGFGGSGPPLRHDSGHDCRDQSGSYYPQE